MKAFIDDMNLFIGKPENTTEEEFMEMVQADINQWHRLCATGRELNTKKCIFSNFNLQFNSNSTPSIQEKTTNKPQLYLTKLDSTKEILETTQPSEGI